MPVNCVQNFSAVGTTYQGINRHLIVIDRLLTWLMPV